MAGYCALSRLASSSREGLVHTAAMAIVSGATLHLLHVLQVSPLSAQGASEGLAGRQFCDSEVEEARIWLEEYAESIPAQVKREPTIDLANRAIQ
jgi:hypothetical protein